MLNKIMEKPAKKKRSPLMNYHDMVRFVEEKYNIDVRDYNGLFGGTNKESHFDKYQRITGDCMPFGNNAYPDVSGKYNKEWQEEGYEGWTIIRDGERIKATKKQYDEDFKLIHAQYKRYQKWEQENPENEAPEYLDYWHWLLNNHFCDVRNPCEEYFNMTEILEDEETPDWVKEITQKFYDEFKDDLDKDGGIEVHISW
jgi:hypothetical protein